MTKRQLRKWYSELWVKFLAAKTRKERRVIREQAFRVHAAIGGAR